MANINMKTVVKKNPYGGGGRYTNSTSNLITMISGVIIGALLLFVTVDRVGQQHHRRPKKHSWVDEQAPPYYNLGASSSSNFQKVSAELNSVKPSDNVGLWIRRKMGMFGNGNHHHFDFEKEDSPASLALKWFIKDPYSKKIVEANNIPRIIQRYVLAMLYYSTKAHVPETAWIYDGIDWLLPTDECEWYGTICNGYELVTGLQLSGTKMNGQLPSTLMLLSNHLTELHFNDSELEGPLPTELGLLSKLTVLDIMFPEEKRFAKKDKSPPPLPKFQGHTIPTELGMLTNLQHLDLDGCGFEGTIPIEIGFLTSLTQLRISRGNGNIMGTLPETMEHLTNLQELHLYGLEKLQGTIPSSICSGTHKDTLRAIIWCGKVECDCCISKGEKPCNES